MFKHIINLTDAEREELNHLIKVASSLVAVRAKMVLEMDENNPNKLSASQIAKKYNVSVSFVNQTRQKFAKSGIKGAVIKTSDKITKETIQKEEKEQRDIKNLQDCVDKLVKDKHMSREDAIKSIKMLKSLYPNDDMVRSIVIETKEQREKRKAHENDSRKSYIRTFHLTKYAKDEEDD